MTRAQPASRILVVDDDADIVEALSLVLETAGYDPLVARNGQEALALLRSGVRPHLILLDLMMPIMNGWRFRAEQMRDPELAALPVVVLTGDGRAIEKAASLGAAGYLSKPVDIDTLLEVIERHCERRDA